LGDLRIGVLGGTFNPIHYGHLHIAREIQKLFSLTQIHFVAATLPPHKSQENLIPFIHRFTMVSLATAGNPSFVPSLVELEPQASPYSVDTLDKLARRSGYGKKILYFIAGGDSLNEVKLWKQSEKLLTSFNFVFAMRPGAAQYNAGDILPPKAAARVRDLTRLRPGHIKRRIVEEGGSTGIYLVDVSAPDISATRIRSLVSSGKPIHRFVPGPVREYINKLHLYGER
jgi:nicotinate-nucleotide adenylyltransferase